MKLFRQKNFPRVGTPTGRQGPVDEHREVSCPSTRDLLGRREPSGTRRGEEGP